MATYPGMYNYPMQQRLNYLEQQYPQFSPQPMLKGRPVSSIDEAKAAMIDLDGTPYYFVDTANNAIYSKQINLDGTASLSIYKKVEDKDQPKPDIPVTRAEFEAEIFNLKSQLNQLLEGIENDKSYANVQRKRQPVHTDSE